MTAPNGTDRDPTPTGSYDLPRATRRRAALYVCERLDKAAASDVLDALGLLDVGLRSGAVTAHA